MGLYSKKINYKALTFFHNSFVSLLIKYLDKLYFLGNEEYKIAINSLEKHDKIVFKPFNIDCEFWKTSKLKIEENNQILFIGNDGNRDFDLLLNIAKIMPVGDTFRMNVADTKPYNADFDKQQLLTPLWCQNIEL